MDLASRRVASMMLAAVLVACSAPPPNLTDAQTASMYEVVAAQLCGNGRCGRVLAHETFVSGLHPGGAELPEHIRQAVTDGVGEVEFLTPAQIEAIFADDPPNTTVLYVGPLRWHLSDVVGVEFGSSCGPLCGSGTQHLFRWDGTEWVPTDPETEGLTVTSWVS
jgi:hypothetical protein